MKRFLTGASLAMVVLLGVMWRCAPSADLPTSSVAPARLFFPGNEGGEVKVTRGQPVELHVLVQQPAYVYVFDSLENGETTLAWGAGQQSPFEAGEYAAEGLDLGELGSHQFLAVTSQEPLQGVEGWKNVAPEPVKVACPDCGLSALTVVVAEPPPALAAESVPEAPPMLGAGSPKAGADSTESSRPVVKQP
jgi:hypothetical protein